MEIKTIWDAALVLVLLLFLVVMVPVLIGGTALYILGVCFGIGTLNVWSAFILGMVIIIIGILYLVFT